MSSWTSDDIRTIVTPDEVQVVTRRADGTPRRPRIIWIVRVDDRLFIRSTNGRTADWFRGVLANPAGQLVADGRTYEVRFAEVDDATALSTVDDAYRQKYGRYASIVDHLQEDGPRAATLEVLAG
jgi:hypothetical protein